MSRRLVVSRLIVVAGALLVLLTTLGFVRSTQAALAAPAPQLTTTSPSATGFSSATPSPAESETDADPADDPTDDGSNPTGDQTGTWVALSAAAALSIAAGLVVVLRKR